MSLLSRERQGECCILLSSLLWAVFPVVTILTFTRLTPLFTAALSTLSAAAFFAIVVTARGQWRYVFERRAWAGILLTTLTIGIIFYGLIFTGLRSTTAGNEAIISLMEVFFSFLILGVLLRHEALARRNVAGAACMIAGAAFILLPKTSGVHIGDWLVLLATVFAPLGNLYTQRARTFVSSEFIMFWRSLLSGCFLLLVAWILEPAPGFPAVRESLGYLVASGILFLGFSKILWIESVHRIPITKAVALESLYPFFTLLIAVPVLHERPSIFQALGFLPILLGVFLLMHKPESVKHSQRTISL